MISFSMTHCYMIFLSFTTLWHLSKVYAFILNWHFLTNSIVAFLYHIMAFPPYVNATFFISYTCYDTFRSYYTNIFMAYSWFCFSIKVFYSVFLKGWLLQHKRWVQVHSSRWEVQGAEWGVQDTDSHACVMLGEQHLSFQSSMTLSFSLALHVNQHYPN